MSIEAKEEYKLIYSRLYDLCEENGWGDPFSYARSREILIASYLGHEISNTLAGDDGYDEEGACEYKSTICENIHGLYSGMSKQSTWEKQKEYLVNEKILPYKNHYFIRFEVGKIKEVWKLSGEDVYTILLPKVKKNYFSSGSRKDPRVRGEITKKEIYDYGKRIL